MSSGAPGKFNRDPKGSAHARKGDRARTARGCPPVATAQAQDLTSFTLVELLIVTAIITLLMSIIVPSYAKARKQARSVACLSNQRQIATAMTAYTHDFADRFPIAQYVDADHSALVAWDTTTSFAGPVAPGLIWQYAPGGAVQQCPAYGGPSMTLGDPYTGYNYNTTYIGRGQNEGPYRGLDESPAMTTQLHAPGRTALVGDGGWKNGANKFMRAPLDSGVSEASVHAGGQAYRHLDQTNVVYADMHGERVKARYRKPGARASNEGRLAWPRNGFLTEDDRAYAISP